MGEKIQGRISAISGPVIEVVGSDQMQMLDMVRVGKEQLIGEVIALRGEKTVCLLYTSIFKKLYVFAKGDTRNFFRYPVLQYEIEVMKRVLRSLETRDSQFGTEQINHFLLEHSGVDFERLLTCLLYTSRCV